MTDQTKRERWPHTHTPWDSLDWADDHEREVARSEESDTPYDFIEDPENYVDSEMTYKAEAFGRQPREALDPLELLYWKAMSYIMFLLGHLAVMAGNAEGMEREHNRLKDYVLGLEGAEEAMEWALKEGVKAKRSPYGGYEACPPDTKLAEFVGHGQTRVLAVVEAYKVREAK